MIMMLGTFSFVMMILPSRLWTWAASGLTDGFACVQPFRALADRGLQTCQQNICREAQGGYGLDCFDCHKIFHRTDSN